MKRRHEEHDGDHGGGGSGGAHALGERVRVRSAEGEEVAWSRSAAARSAALANWLSDTGGAEGAFESNSGACGCAPHALARRRGPRCGGWRGAIPALVQLSPRGPDHPSPALQNDVDMLQDCRIREPAGYPARS